MDNKVPAKVNCFQCKHFVVTWEPKYPRSCGLFGFKSAHMPSSKVFESTGEPCAGFESKRAPKSGSKRNGWEA